MYTLLLVYKPYDDLTIFCPLCKKNCNNIETDDYVGNNILFWCSEHGEILICPTGLNREENELLLLEKGEVKNSCSVLLTEKELVTYAEKNGFVLSSCLRDSYEDRNLSDFYAYKVGVLKISHVYSTAEDPKNSDDNLYSPRDRTNIPYHEVDVFSFSEIKYDTSHDGIYLYYKGSCSECERKYESFIWGD